MLAEQTQSADDDADTAISNAARDRVIEAVRRKSGIHLADTTCQFVETRLRRRMRKLGIADPDLYIDYVESHSEETEHFINAFTTNETSFFRTRPLWDYFANTLFPAIAEGSGHRTPKLWSAACSSGEEAYSLAMLSEQLLPPRKTGPNARIDATDISTEALAKAAAGRYSGRNIERLKAARLDIVKKHFEREGDEYVVKDDIRNYVQFKQHNLMRRSELVNEYDLVMLRNVLIYFTQDDQAKILRNLYDSIRSGGILAIGESESLGFFESGFEYVRPFVYRKP